nr:hypothetical protein [Pandoravirus aubagnensis]
MSVRLRLFVICAAGDSGAIAVVVVVVVVVVVGRVQWRVRIAACTLFGTSLWWSLFIYARALLFLRAHERLLRRCLLCARSRTGHAKRPLGDEGRREEGKKKSREAKSCACARKANKAWRIALG